MPRGEHGHEHTGSPFRQIHLILVFVNETESFRNLFEFRFQLLSVYSNKFRLTDCCYYNNWIASVCLIFDWRNFMAFHSFWIVLVLVCTLFNIFALMWLLNFCLLYFEISSHNQWKFRTLAQWPYSWNCKIQPDVRNLTSSWVRMGNAITLSDSLKYRCRFYEIELKHSRRKTKIFQLKLIKYSQPAISHRPRNSSTYWVVEL